MRCTHNPQKSLFCQSPEHQYYTEWGRIEAILNQHPAFLDMVYNDLTEGLKHPEKGARGMTAEQALRAGILKQANGWTYRELEIQCFDSTMTRIFLKLDFDQGFSSSCLQANVKRIAPVTWEKISKALVLNAKENEVENGKVVRIDATPIECNIHKPTDSSLLFDCIRSANLQFERLRTKGVLKAYSAVKTNEAKSLWVGIFNTKKTDVREDLYRKLLKAMKKTFERIEGTLKRLESSEKIGFPEYEQLRRLSQMVPLVIDQTNRRVIKGEKVPAEEKILSIFEPHTDLIVKGERDVVYGHKVFFTVGTTGLVLDTVLVQGNPKDTEYFIDLLDRHKETFDRYPRQVVTDGGFASEDNLFDAKDLGIKDVCFTKSLGLEIEEMVKSKWVFDKLKNFRAGIEAVISCLKRGFGLDRVTWTGVRGFGSYVHSTIVAYNLITMARLTPD